MKTLTRIQNFSKVIKTLECALRGEKYDIVDANTQAILGKNAYTEIGSNVRVQ